MIAYVDSSVLLRLLLKQPSALAEWKHIEIAAASTLLQVECLRTLDRLKMRMKLDDATVADFRSELFPLLDAIHLIEIDWQVLERASQSFPTEIGTLDAIHLATALLWRETSNLEVVMATHDVSLSIAARAHGFKVVGTTLRHR